MREWCMALTSHMHTEKSVWCMLGAGRQHCPHPHLDLSAALRPHMSRQQAGCSTALPVLTCQPCVSPQTPQTAADRQEQQRDTVATRAVAAAAAAAAAPQQPAAAFAAGQHPLLY